jgi:hypothetical protein
LYANTNLGPNSLAFLNLRDCYFEQNSKTSPYTFDCHLVGKVYGATLANFNVNVDPDHSRGAVKIDGGAGCVVSNIIVSPPSPPAPMPSCTSGFTTSNGATDNLK